MEIIRNYTSNLDLILNIMMSHRAIFFRGKYLC